MTEAPADYPLSGLKVLDLSRVLAGPFAGRLLADLGADVVKVEPPEGDVTRFWGRVKGGVPGFYHQQNAGKRNISIDLRAPGARELMLDLVRGADVLIENYRPDVMGRLGWTMRSCRRPTRASSCCPSRASALAGRSRAAPPTPPSSTPRWD